MISLHAKRFKLLVGVAADLSLASVLMASTQAQKVQIASYTPPADTLSDCGDAREDRASTACGKSAQFVGDAALYVPLKPHTDFYLTASRDLSAGIVEPTALLNTFGAGLCGLDPRTNRSYQGTFSELSVAYRLGPWFYQDIPVRRFEVHGGPSLASPAPAQLSDHQSLVAVTFWWSRTERPDSSFSSLTYR